MSDRRSERQSGDKDNGADMGVWTAMGAAFGVVVFAVTGEAYWIAVGAGVGVALGAGIRSRRTKSSGE